METTLTRLRGAVGCQVGNQVPRYSGWKRRYVSVRTFVENLVLETKYRDIADGNRRYVPILLSIRIELETKYRDIADGNVAD